MPAPDERTRLRHILDAARRAISLGEQRNADDLAPDSTTNLAIVRLFEIIGEAAKAISDTLRKTHPEVPWRQMAGTRDRLIHGYFDINLRMIWDAVDRDLPGVVKGVERILLDTPEDP